jgi:hypothetical protein
MNNQTTSKQYLFQLQLIHGAQVMTLLVFGVVAYFISSSKEPETIQSENILTYVLAATVIVSLSAAHFIFNLFIRKMDKNTGLKSKLQKYQTAVLIRSAVLEFPGLFAGVVCILSGSLLPLMGLAVVLAVFVLLRPSVTAIIRDLALSAQEKMVLENPNSTLI